MNTLSVIVATYNRGPRIRKTLDSIVAQGDTVSEMIVVDDGSTDATADWIRQHYPQVRVVEKPNGGTSSARNFGARTATGDLLVFLDHDDQFLTDAVATLRGLLKQAPDARAAFTDHQLHDLADGTILTNHHSVLPNFKRLREVPYRDLSGSSRYYSRRALYRTMILGNLLQQPWVIDRNAFLALGGFDETVRYCEDWDLYLRLVAAYPIVVSDDVISIHFLEHDGSNLSRANGQEEMHVLVLQKHLNGHRHAFCPTAFRIRTKLATYYKVFGDRYRTTNCRLAWQYYWKSILTWPFDPVVAARLLLWLPGAMRQRHFTP